MSKTPGSRNIHSPLTESRVACTISPRFTCALGGALATVWGIVGAIPIVHSSAGCSRNLYMGQCFGSGWQTFGHARGLMTPSTSLVEKHVIFGGEGRLVQQMKASFEITEADLYFVLSGCQVALIGDDIRTIVDQFKERKDQTIIMVETPGFKGNSYAGYDMVGRALVEQLVEPPDENDEQISVNLFGIVPAQDPFWQGNIIEIKRLLNRLGVSVRWSGDYDTIDTIKKSSNADLNIVLSEYVGVSTAELFKQKFGVPWIKYNLPIGSETSKFLRIVAEALGIDRELVDLVIDSEEEQFLKQLDRLGHLYAGFNLQRDIGVIADSTYSIGLIKFLANDFGMNPTFVAVSDEPPAEIHDTIRKEILGLDYGLKPQIIIESDGNKIWRALEESHPTFLLAGSFDKRIADRLDIPRLSVSYPITDRVILSRGYAGYRGSITLIEDIVTVLMKDMHLVIDSTLARHGYKKPAEQFAKVI
ncbi:MAG: hypothetical protein FIB08_00050 [Candidatus Methanoperedens sp.]|nr:hypothetical protein [Candidatus Methanoperedens sp.]